MSLKELNNTDRNKLIDLLKSSQLTAVERRRVLCGDIRIDIGNIPQAMLLADNDFGKHLIDILFQRKLEESLCRLCKILEKEFPDGDYSNDLRIIQEKLKSDPDRDTLLKKVQETRVDPFLNPFLENESKNQKWIQLYLEKLSENDPSPDTIINIFDQMHDKKTLLILGEPGSGKTTILADLTNELIERARKNKGNKIPIILNLSSWNDKQTIDQWSVEQLKDFYQVPEKKGWNLVTNEQLLLLIDGFDELKSESQKSCVNALNTFITNYDSTQIVVCSRTDDKDNENEEKEKLLQGLKSKITRRLKYLELPKAIQYLKENSDHDWLITSIENNNKLKNLIKIPLFLYLIIEVYKSNNQSQETGFLQENSEAKIWERIFDKYIEKLLNQWKSGQNNSQKVNNNKNNDKEEVKRYLIWLAEKMDKEGQTEFLIEKMQPKWLSQAPDSTSQESNQLTNKEKIYRIGVRLIVGLLCGLASGLFSEILNYNPNPNLQISSINYIFFGLISGLLSGLIFGLMIFLPKDLEDKLISKSGSERRRSALLMFVMIGLTSGLIRWVVNLLLEEGKTQPLDAIIFGIVSGFLFYRLKSPEIETVDKMNFSKIEFIKNSISAGIISLFVGTIMLFVGTLSKLNYDSGRLLITLPMQKFLETIFNTPWFDNFLEKAVEQLIINYQQDNNSVRYGFLAFILFIVINLLVWITLERIKYEPTVITEIPIGIKLAFVVELITVIICYLILKSTFSQYPDISYLYFNFFNSLNIFWGLLTLELYVGLLVGISLGFKKDITIENVTKPNYGIIRTRNNALQASVISGACSFVVSVAFWLIYYNHQDLIWWIYYKPEKSYNAIFFGLIVGLKLGLLSGLINGGNSGLVCIKHFVLRVVLWRYKKIPWDYARFLKNAAEQGLLIQTGGSFRFKHLMLLEYIIKHTKKRK